MSIPLGKAMDDIARGLRPERRTGASPTGVPAAAGGPGLGSDPRREVVEPNQAWSISPTWRGTKAGNNADTRPDGKGLWFRFELGPKAVITRPSGGQRLPGPGFYEITGLAWTGGGAVRKVDVSTDGGRTYKEAELQQPVHRYAHTRFRFPWKWSGEEAVLQARCTDERGEVQPTIAEAAKILGVTPDYFYRGRSLQWHSALEGNRDGSIQNALFL